MMTHYLDIAPLPGHPRHPKTPRGPKQPKPVNEKDTLAKDTAAKDTQIVVMPVNDSLPANESVSAALPVNSAASVMSTSGTPWGIMLVLAVLVLCFGALFAFRRYFAKKR